MTISTINTEPVKGMNTKTTDFKDLSNCIENGICTVNCVASTTTIDGSGDFKITRRLECTWNSPGVAGENIFDVEIAGTKGSTPVVSLNGQVLPSDAVKVAPNGMVEIRDLNGMLLDKVQIPAEAVSNYQVTGGIGMNPKPFLGITVRPVSPDLAHNLAVDARNVCVVSEVLPGSAAFYAGLEPNDLILGINGKQANIATLRQELDVAKIGQVISLIVLCKGIKNQVQVPLDGNTLNTLNTLSTPVFQGMPQASLGGYGAGWKAAFPGGGVHFGANAPYANPFAKVLGGVCPLTGMQLSQGMPNLGQNPLGFVKGCAWTGNAGQMSSML